MAKDAPDYRDQLIFHIMFWLLIGITLAGLTARIYVRVYLRGSIFNWRSWHLSDFLVTLTWFGFFVCGFIEIFIFTYYDITPSTAGSLPREQYVQQAKMGITFNTTFWLWVFMIKLAMLCFLDEIVPMQMRPCWIAIRVTAVLVVIGGLSSFVYSFFWCMPFERQWSAGADFCWMQSNMPSRRAQRLYRQIWHCSTDLMILAIPVPLIPHLANVGLRQRIGAAVMLFLGAFCTFSAIVYTVLEAKMDSGWNSFDPTTANYMQYEPIVELAAAIFIQCVPSMKYLLSSQRKKDAQQAAYGSGSGGYGSRSRSRDVRTPSSKRVFVDEERLHVLEMQDVGMGLTSPASSGVTVTVVGGEEVLLPDVQPYKYSHSHSNSHGRMGDMNTWRHISDGAISGHSTYNPRVGW